MNGACSPGRPAPGRSLRASLAYLIAARLVLNTAHRFAYPFLPAISRGLGITLEQGGLLMSARAVAGLATPLVVATVGRGERRRRTLAVGLALFALGAAVTAAAGVYAGALTGFALFGLAKPLFDISGQAYIADRVPYHRRGRYIALFETTWALALLVGAPAAGWLIARLGWQAPFWAVAGLALVALAVLPWAMDRDTPPAAGTPVPRLRLNRSAALILVAVFALMFAAEVSFVVFGAWLEDRFGLSLVALGGAATAIAVAELAGEGASFALTDRLGPAAQRVDRPGDLHRRLRRPGPGFRAAWAAGLTVLVLAFFGFEFAIVSALPLATEVAPEARARFLALTVVALSGARAAGRGGGPGPVLLGRVRRQLHRLGGGRRPGHGAAARGAGAAPAAPHSKPSPYRVPPPFPGGRTMPETTEFAPGTFCWVDGGTTDLAKAQAFYAAVFGWEYAIADDTGYTMCLKDGKPVAGLYALDADMLADGSPPFWIGYVAVADADATMAAAVAAGAQPMGPVFEVPGHGRGGGLHRPDRRHVRHLAGQRSQGSRRWPASTGP